MAAQQQVSRDQQAVQRAETTLAQILSKTASSTNGTSSPSTGAAPGGTSSKGTNSSGEANTTATNSAAQLASDQASIDSDQASLVSAQQSLDNAKLTAPIAGTVTTVNITKGQTVSAGSSSDSITVSDPGTYETTSTLTSSQVDEVAVGDRVQVSVDGQSTAVTGTVSQVGPVESSSSSYSYPLIAFLAAGSIPAGSTVSGASAQLTVELSDAANIVVVPTSAVHTTSVGNSYVIVLQVGQETRKTVKVGVVGPIYSQITSALTAGTRVVLADPSQPVPSSSSNSTSNFRGLPSGGGFPSGPPSGFVSTANGG